MIIISNSQDGKRLAKKLKCSSIIIKELTYPDNEVELSIVGDLKKNTEKIIYFQFNAEKDFDAQIFNLLVLLNSVGDKKNTKLILPYLPYSRSLPLENKNAINKLAFILGELDKFVSQVFFLQPHGEIPFLADSLENTKLTLIKWENTVAGFVKKLSKDYVFVSPDHGFARRIKNLAELNQKEYIILKKERISPSKVKIQGYEETVQKKQTKSFVIVDDISSTGKTLLAAIGRLKQKGAKNIFCVIIHNLIQDKKVFKSLKSSGVKLFFTNSLYQKQYSIDVIDDICKSL